jgi:hypothetical protein
MTRAAVANLNRQRASNEAQNPLSDSIPNTHVNVSSTPNSSPAASPSNSKKPAQKLLPPQPSTKRSKDLPDVPEFYIVRPAPSTSGAKVERNDRRVFVSRGSMERINVFQGSVVLIHRHNPNRREQLPTLEETEKYEHNAGSYDASDDEEDTVEQATVGVAWPMDRIEPNGISSSKIQS